MAAAMVDRRVRWARLRADPRGGLSRRVPAGRRSCKASPDLGAGSPQGRV